MREHRSSTNVCTLCSTRSCQLSQSHLALHSRRHRRSLYGAFLQHSTRLCEIGASSDVSKMVTGLLIGSGTTMITTYPRTKAIECTITTLQKGSMYCVQPTTLTHRPNPRANHPRMNPPSELLHGTSPFPPPPVSPSLGSNGRRHRERNRLPERANLR